jgi:Mlc titration factor MtfA (ptsG expression regulator)
VGLIAWWRRRQALKQPFQDTWRVILEADVPFYGRLGKAGKTRFEEKMKVFLLTKYFIPAGGMEELSERHKVVISAAAARLSMNLPGEHYPRLTEIIVYPSAYKHEGNDDAIIFGEAHHFGTVVLSWDAVIQGMKNDTDGHNTAMHEFAHVLDIADGQFDGTPVLPKMGSYRPWAKVMSSAFLKLRGKGAEKKKSVMRKYGATNEAEFFAVATETFFEKPRQMKEKHPELYQLLMDYYRVDPAAEEAGEADAA